MSMSSHRVAGFALVAALALTATSAHALDQIKIGVGKLASTAPVLIAQDKGYFAAENLTAEFVFFDAAQTITMGVAGGELDLGVTAVSGAFYQLAGQGSIKLVAGTVRDAPGFQQYGFVISNHAYEGGFKGYKDMAGHSVAIVQVGGPIHYALALLEEKYGIDPATVKPLPLQSIPNQVTAVLGGSADAGVLPATSAMPGIQRGDMKLLSYTGDEVQWQAAGAFATTKTITDKPELIERFLRAFNKGMADYRAAFVGPGEKRQNGPLAPEILAIIGKYLSQTPEQIEQGIPYLDTPIDVKDIAHQLDWYRAQGMIKGEFKAEDVVAAKYIVRLK
jgi:NitT/TauT family transport system substrate-binding protein